MQCSTHSHCFVWIDAFVWRFSGFLFNGFLNRWNPSRTSNEDDLVDIALLDACILHGLTSWAHGCFNELRNEVFEFGSTEGHVHVFWLSISHCDEREIDLCLLGSRKFDLRLFCRFLQSGHSLCIFAEVDASVSLEFCNHPLDHEIVEIIATEFVVSGCCLDFDLWLSIDLVNFQN